MSENTSTRVERSRIQKMQSLLNMTRIFAGVISLTAFILVVTSVDGSVWNFRSFWYGMKFVIFLFELVFLLAGFGLMYILGGSDASIAGVMTAIHVALFGGNETVLGIPIEDLVSYPLQIPQQQSLIDAFFAFIIIIFAIIALVSGVGFLKECNPGLSAISFFSLNIILGLASLNGKLMFNLDFTSANFIQTIFSKLVITAFLLYFSLELSFQASYIYSVIGPNLERNRRISNNIRRLKRFELPVGPKRETKEDEEIEVGGKNTTQARLKVTTAFSQLRAMVGKKLFKISPEEDWDKMNNRLKNFYLKLEENDPLISLSLSASAYTPSMGRLLFIIISGTLFRMVALLLLTWMALNPVPVLTFLNVPESIVNSAEAGQHEMIMMILLPLALFFMLLGLIVQWAQKKVSERMAKNSKVIRTVEEEKEAQASSSQPQPSTTLGPE
ncbi:MAG: hypothetical protein ACFFDW_05380 [Candidatus Thorarchaeota archaeon]